MNKKLLSFILIAVLICSLSATAFADTDGHVTFKSDNKLHDDFDVTKVFDGLEPGDSRSYSIEVKNENSKTTRWYMSNTVLKSLEDGYSIHGGAYTYLLTYTSPGGKTTTIYDSRDRSTHYVGGDYISGSNSKAAQGLHEATSNLEDYFFLDTLNSNESGIVTLTVALEGETQDNTYQNTAARIRMNFAVEVTSPNNPPVVKTGDENNLVPYYIGMVVAGLLFLYLALDSYTDRKYKKGRN